METLADIIHLGNTAADAGGPLVTNWPQMRGALYMIAHAGGGLDQVRTSDFNVRFPADFHVLDPATQAAFPSEGTYASARHQVSRMLAALGAVDDPWEQLRMMIRRAGRQDDIERCLAGLATPAKEAGLTPSNIRSDWVWSLDAERGVPTDEQLERRALREQQGRPKAKLETLVRQRLRRGVAVFNALFDIQEIADSGLLPLEPIGPPPVYDHQGRLPNPLPPTLAAYQAQLADPSLSSLPQVWQAICAAETFDLPPDPTADDLLAKDTWAMIETLPQSITYYARSTWSQYITRLRTALVSHATLPMPERLPERFEVLIANREDRRPPLQALWRLMCESDMTDAKPDDLLHLAIWRDLWRKEPQNIAPLSWRRYESCARSLLVKHATHLSDPYRVVTRAWADLPKGAKVALDPIRKEAERALMRPLDLTLNWVAAQDLDPAQEAQVTDALREVFFAAAQFQKVADSDPVTVVWGALRIAIQAQGISTIGLGRVATPATNDGLVPLDLTPAWAVATAARMDYRTRAKFADALRKIDGLLNIPDLAPLLYAERISVLPDARKHGKIDRGSEEIISLDDGKPRTKTMVARKTAV